MTTLSRKLRTIHGLPPLERKLALVTIALTGSVRLALWFLPFRWIKRGVERNAAAEKVHGANQPSARQIAWAVKLASRYIPHASCLTQALTGQILLNRAGIENTVHIGVALGATGEPAGRSGFGAHAWVEHDGAVLIGGVTESARYSPILTLRKSNL